MGGQVGDIGSIKADCAAAWHYAPGKQADECGLAGTVWANERVNLACGQVKID
jgi:hypothetical protein